MKYILILLNLFVCINTYSQNLEYDYIVTIEGKQPYVNTDWDLVHGILGSNRLNDDLEDRVSDKLSQLSYGNYNVKSIKITSYKHGDYIYTKAEVRINKSYDNKSYTVFTTRGSIGYNYVKRHDEQVFGLPKRLSDAYGGDVKVFGPYIVCVSDENGECFMKYKQSFYTVGK
jgi:hypothetical protein